VSRDVDVVVMTMVIAVMATLFLFFTEDITFRLWMSDEHT
jgi:hypothetical protein